MTLKTRTKEKGLNAFMILILFLGMGIYSITSNAQEIQNTGLDPIENVSNTDKKINLLASVNTEISATSLHGKVNSAYAELKPTLTPNGTRLYFSRSYHPDNTFGETDAEDIWYSNYDKITEIWSDPVRMPGFLNNDGPNFINNVSMTGDTIILGNQYKGKGRMRAGLSYSVNVDGRWSIPASINIVNDYNMSEHANAYVSLKSGIIIKAIERGETFGHRDLYVSFWDGTKATEPINMGGVLNTSLEESSPYLASDNKSLYFASKGHAGYGGFDIFVSHRLDDSWTNWSVPENLGPAVNGAMDDEFFSITHCGKYAIFSKQISVHNSDLFKVSTAELFGENYVRKQNSNKKLNSAFVSL